MMSRIATVTLVLLVALPTFAQGTKGSAKASFNVRDLLTREYAGWSTMDPAKVAPFYAKDADAIFFDIAPLMYHGWSEYQAGTTKLFSGYKSFHLTPPHELHSKVLGDWAWSTCLTDFDAVTKDGKPEKVTARVTTIFEKRKGQWLIVHEHTSVPAP